MEIILSHDHMDFDALASMVAASRIYPDASIVLSSQQSEQVQEYLAIYRDNFPFVWETQITWDRIDHIILTDVSTLERTSASSLTDKNIAVTVYDHHPLAEKDKRKNITYYLHHTGAAVTILLEEIMKQQLEISKSEATLYALGLYTDTGSFTYPGTTVRDLKAAVFLMDKGMHLELVQQFSEETLSFKQQKAFQRYLASAEDVGGDGLQLVVANLSSEEHIGGLSVITSRLIEMTGADAVVTVTSMQNKVFIIGRSASDRVRLRSFMQKFHGDGHERAASASIKGQDLPQVLKEVKQTLIDSVAAPVTASSIMSAPVKTITQDTRVDDTKQQMLYYGHNGFPVVDENNNLTGIISRRDIDKATQHNLGHAPVKGYMSTEPVTITKETSFEDILHLLTQHNIGRLPVLADSNMIGIVSRTDVIEQLHTSDSTSQKNIKRQMETYLPDETINLLKQLGELARSKQVKAYIIGGIVRDLILNQPSEDVDIVIDGDAIALAEAFAAEKEAEVSRHESFGTATVLTKTGRRLDFTTSRTEYYKKPAALPTVSPSNLKEDLFRRDFTMNAMAASLQPDSFGNLIDYFNGLSDIFRKKLRVLHNLSFVEDPTRILRGVRFESRFSFLMDKETEAFIHHSVSAIASLSQTRIVTELNYLFIETNPLQSIDRLSKLGVLNKFFQGSVWDEKTRTILTALLQPKIHDLFSDYQLNQRFYITACLYLKDADTVKHCEAAAITKKQKKIAHDIVYLFEHDSQRLFSSAGSFHAHASHLDKNALILTALAFDAEDEEQQRKAKLIRFYYKKREKLPNWVDGNDLKKAGLRPGPAYKEYLFELEQKIIDGKITNRKDALDYIQHRIEQKKN